MTHEAIAMWTETSSDPELIAGVRAGDGTAFGLLYERHVGAAKKVAAQYTNSASDVDDVVAESFSRVLRALQRGDGPDLAFRAYLFTIVRRTGMEYVNRGNRTRPGDDMSTYEDAIGYDAPSDEGVLVGFEQGIVAEAFKSLPERWQAVLWYTEVEKKSPKDIAPLLGLTANGVAALAYRAREALRQAYLQQHLNTAESLDCLAASAQLGAYVRGGLAKREHAKVDDHVQSCEKCSGLVVELEDVNRGMRGIIAPLVLGILGMGALEGGLPIGGALGAAGAAGASGGTSGAASGGTSGGAVAGSASGATGVAVAGTGIAAWVSTASAIALPAAAALGVVALVVSGASYLGVFKMLGNNEGQTPVASSTPSPSPSPSGDSTQPAQPSPSPSASDSPSTEPEVSPTPDAGDGGHTTGEGVIGTVPGGTSGHATDPDPTPTPTDSSEPSPEPSATPTTDPTPDPSPTSTTDPTPKTVTLAFGAAPSDHIDVSQAAPAVGISLDNTGDGAAEDVTASIVLPDGLTFAAPTGGAGPFALAPAARIATFMSFAGASTFAAGDWDCTLDSARSTATCSLPELAAGGSATLNLALAPVTDVTLLASDARTRFSASAGTVSTSYSVGTGIKRSQKDISVGFVATGSLGTTQAGATLMGCNTKSEACRRIMSSTLTDDKSELNNNGQKMVPLNTAGGKVSSATTSLTGTLLPEGAKVTYALLEWSAGKAKTGDTWTGALDVAQLRTPGGTFEPVEADAVVHTTVGAGEFYQARADITSLVAAAGRGEYSLADIALSSGNLGKDNSYFGGFTITVVYELAGLPQSQVAVLTGNQLVQSGKGADFTFSADSASTVQIGWTAWDTDRGIHGDMVRLDGDNFTPLGWNGTGTFSANSGNAGDSTAFGGEWANSLGVDAKAFVAKKATTGLHTVSVSTKDDAFVIGSLTITVAATK